MDRCSSFTSHSFGKFRCFSIQKASVEDFGSIGNGLAVTAWVKEAKNDDRRENGQAGRKNRTCHWWDKRDWSCYRETLRSGRSICLHHRSTREGSSRYFVCQRGYRKRCSPRRNHRGVL